MVRVHDCCSTQQNGTVEKATEYTVRPFIDAEPANPDTVLTSLVLVEEFVTKQGQKYVYVVVDIQLYKIASEWLSFVCC